MCPFSSISKSSYVSISSNISSASIFSQDSMPSNPRYSIFIFTPFPVHIISIALSFKFIAFLYMLSKSYSNEELFQFVIFFFLLREAERELKLLYTDLLPKRPQRQGFTGLKPGSGNETQVSQMSGRTPTN